MPEKCVDFRIYFPAWGLVWTKNKMYICIHPTLLKQHFHNGIE